MRRFLGITAAVLVVLAIAAAVVVFSIYRAARHVPAFYAKTLAADPDEVRQAGRRLEQHVVDLAAEVNRQQRWHALVTADEINGWLAAELPDKFPDQIPPGASDPRVAIGEGRLFLACRYDGDPVDLVLSLELEVYLTGEVNEIAVRFHKARAGLLPMPLGGILEQVSRLAEEADLPLEWAQRDGDPVALVTIPRRHDGAGRRLLLDTLELREGEMYLAGRSEKEADDPQDDVE